MMVFEYPCKVCKAAPGNPCTLPNGTPRPVMHDSRRAPKEKRKQRKSTRQAMKQVLLRLSKIETELAETKKALSEERLETKRLKRLLRTTDVGTMLDLRAKLKEAEARVRYLMAEILD